MKAVQWIALLVFLSTGIPLLVFALSGYFPRRTYPLGQFATPAAIEATLVAEMATQIAMGTPAGLELSALDATKAAMQREVAASALEREMAASQVSSVFSAASLLIANLVSLATFVATTIYRIWDERRTRGKYKLEMTKTELEILKLKDELEEVQRKKKHKA